MNPQAFICDAIRTPFGRYGGALSSVRTDDLGAIPLKAVMARNKEVDWAAVTDVIFGCANQAGEDNRNVARMSSLLAGLPIELPGSTINRLCGSGMDAVGTAARAIKSGEAQLMVAGGVESMTRAPFVMAKNDEPFSRKTEIYDTTIGWRFTNSKLAKIYHPFSMGETAENVADKWKVSREDQDKFALASQQKYFQAQAAGKFKEELVAVPVTKGKESFIFDKDEYPRETSLEKLAALKPAFKEGGSVTAGNSSGINDGAAASLIASEEFVKKNNLKPLVRVVSVAIAGVDPAYMGIGPVPASQKALLRAGLKISDLGLVELNEAFASQALASMCDLGLDSSIVNVNGGSIAIGHPLGCSGVRISATLIHEMKKRNVKYGLASMCIGVGQGAAVIYENLG